VSLSDSMSPNEGEDGDGTASTNGVISLNTPPNGPRANALRVDLTTGFRVCIEMERDIQ